MAKGLIPIVLWADANRDNILKRLDTSQIVDRKGFRVLQELPVLFIKSSETPPQIGVFAHLTSLDFNEMPCEANAILLSKRTIKYNGMDVYAGVYCHLQEREDD